MTQQVQPLSRQKLAARSPHPLVRASHFNWVHESEQFEASHALSRKYRIVILIPRNNQH